MLATTCRLTAGAALHKRLRPTRGAPPRPPKPPRPGGDHWRDDDHEDSFDDKQRVVERLTWRAVLRDLVCALSLTFMIGGSIWFLFQAGSVTWISVRDEAMAWSRYRPNP